MTVATHLAHRLTTAAPTILELADLHVSYGAISALRGIDMAVREGEVVALLGANGAGKTTTLRTISGLHRPAAGAVRFCGERIDGVPSHSVVGLGIGHSPEGRRVFADMQVPGARAGGGRPAAGGVIGLAIGVVILIAAVNKDSVAWFN
ncbi:ATP-binding cassette domain-containing protein, partial [Streptomyces sp. NPDC001193]